MRTKGISRCFFECFLVFCKDKLNAKRLNNCNDVKNMYMKKGNTVFFTIDECIFYVLCVNQNYMCESKLLSSMF